MNKTPHFLLISESRDESQLRHGQRGSWRFLLEDVGGSERIEAADVEHGICGERLELLAVVRGLEALDQPSRVTLITPSEHVRRGLRFGLEDWRGNDWMWERFGQLVPIKNHDLWRRVDRALRIHDVECRTFRFDLGHAPKRPVFSSAAAEHRYRRPIGPPRLARFLGRWPTIGLIRSIAQWWRKCFPIPSM